MMFLAQYLKMRRFSQELQALRLLMMISYAMLHNTHSEIGSTPWMEPALDAADRVLAVPLSTERLRERGFNQSALLARQLAGTKVDCHTLLRLHATEAQSGLPRAQRLRNLRGAFAVEPARAASLRGQRVVLIDDVMTTGATLHAATLALREAGVAHVTATVLARTGLD